MNCWEENNMHSQMEINAISFLLFNYFSILCNDGLIRQLCFSRTSEFNGMYSEYKITES